MASKGRPYKTVPVEGFDVLVGKGDVENDRLTFEVAAPDDLWLHVAGFSGSHVVVRNPDALPELPRPVVERAAELAAWHSKGRAGGGKVEVRDFPKVDSILAELDAFADAVVTFLRDATATGHSGS